MKAKRARAVRSEEIQDIIERMPTKWATLVALIVAFLMTVVIILSFFIHYPDVVSGNVTITAEKAPVRMLSNATGRLMLLRPEKSSVKEGDIIAYISSGANFQAVLYIDSLLSQNRDALFSGGHPQLGDLGNTYYAYVSALEDWRRMKTSSRYRTACAAMEDQARSARKILDKLHSEENLRNQSLETARERVRQDSVLLEIDGISKREYKQSYDTYIGQCENLIEVRTAQLLKGAEIDKNVSEMKRLKEEEQEALKQSYASYEASLGLLVTSLQLWKERYLLVAPIAGALEYLGFWRDNVHVQSGEELFAILPEKNQWRGEVIIPSVGAGKVKKGQEVQVKLLNYPYDEYGKIRGRVETISTQTSKVALPTGTSDVYRVLISFPEGLRTNFNKKLSLSFETKGTAEIITRPKRLIQRLFDNLKTSGER